MSLPKYIVNLDEFAATIKNNLDVDINLDTSYIENLTKDKLDQIIRLLIELLNSKGYYFVKGDKKPIPAIVNDFVIPVEFEDDVYLTDFVFAQSGWKSDDLISVEVAGHMIIEKIPTKELAQKKSFEYFFPLPKNEEVKIIYHNISGNSKMFFFDFGYLKQIPNIKLPKINGAITIKYFDLTEERFLDVDNFINLTEDEYVFSARTFKGYKLIEDQENPVFLKIQKGDRIEYIFKYIKEDAAFLLKDFECNQVVSAMLKEPVEKFTTKHILQEADDYTVLIYPNKANLDLKYEIFTKDQDDNEKLIKEVNLTDGKETKIKFETKEKTVYIRVSKGEKKKFSYAKYIVFCGDNEDVIVTCGMNITTRGNGIKTEHKLKLNNDMPGKQKYYIEYEYYSAKDRIIIMNGDDIILKQDFSADNGKLEFEHDIADGNELRIIIEGQHKGSSWIYKLYC